ncbi:MAG: cupin fold metalloprotein, WbuC family [Elusimicrobia bacterium]|nr:cupin fold metalloprotein, WbuC family [Elusimicrobiota bacterium]
MPESIFNTRDICAVDAATLADIERLAAESPRRRFRLCMHHSTEARVHEMVISLTGKTFVQPHRHVVPKAESYHVIKGEMDVFFFGGRGEVAGFLGMGDLASGKPFLYRLSSSTWHMPLPRSETVVFHEVYEGPFVKDIDVEYAPWAPSEADSAGIAEFLARAYAEAARLGGRDGRPAGRGLRFPPDPR